MLVALTGKPVSRPRPAVGSGFPCLPSDSIARSSPSQLQTLHRQAKAQSALWPEQGGYGRRLHGVASFLGSSTPSPRLSGSNATLIRRFNIPGHSLRHRLGLGSALAVSPNTPAAPSSNCRRHWVICLGGYVELPGSLGQRPLALDGCQGHFRLECWTVVPARASCHALSSLSAIRPISRENPT